MRQSESKMGLSVQLDPAHKAGPETWDREEGVSSLPKTPLLCHRTGRGEEEKRSKRQEGWGFHVIFPPAVWSPDWRGSSTCLPNLVTSNQSPQLFSHHHHRHSNLSPQLQFLGSSQKNKTVNKDRTGQGGSWVGFLSLAL